MGVTFEKLEQCFFKVLVRGRRGEVLIPLPEEAYSAHAFFDVRKNEETGNDPSILPAKLPFETIWITTNFRGIAIVAYVERVNDWLICPDHLLYTERIPGERLRCTSADIDEYGNFIIDECLRKLLTNNLEEAASRVQKGINDARERKGEGRKPLPPFIRINNRAVEEPDAGEVVEVIEGEFAPGTHASPQGHERRGHWRTYKASGRRVWINEMKINGGSTEPRAYRM